jgi:hypothetical protein
MVVFGRAAGAQADRINARIPSEKNIAFFFINFPLKNWSSRQV